MEHLLQLGSGDCPCDCLEVEVEGEAIEVLVWDSMDGDVERTCLRQALENRTGKDTRVSVSRAKDRVVVCTNHAARVPVVDAPDKAWGRAMKRFRFRLQDFDFGVNVLTLEVKDDWSDSVKESHREARRSLIESLAFEFGPSQIERKVLNYRDLGPKPFTAIAVHNRFHEQVRRAFIVGAYYPALTGACALGERILNHLLLRLRGHFTGTPEYKRVHGKESFANWSDAITVLRAWSVLRNGAADGLGELENLRQKSIHFSPELDTTDRDTALTAMKLLVRILDSQFGVFGEQPWVIPMPLGEIYVRKESESDPFVREFVLPSCEQVGPRHLVASVVPWRFEDDSDYPDAEVSDEEFIARRLEFLKGDAHASAAAQSAEDSGPVDTSP